MYPDLLLRKSGDFFPKKKVSDSILGFTWDYIFTGKYLGLKFTGYIELAVTTWLIDSEETVFMRCCKYSGHKKNWKNVINTQILKMMQDLNIENEIIKSELRYFKVSSKKYAEPELYNKKLYDIKHMKNNR